MHDNLHLVCPHCQAVNRIPAARLHDHPKCGQCSRPLFDGHPLELDANTLERHLSRNDIPLLIDFWAPWCGPCKMMAPAFQQAAQRLEPQLRLAKVNTEQHPQLGARFAVRSIPTLLLFSGGQERARQSGAMDAAAIERWVRAAG